MTEPVPDLERRTRYAPLVPTLEFLVGFPVYGEDDVSVFHDGIEVDGDLYEVLANFTDGVSTNASVIVSDPAGWSNVIVDIVGDRRPRRQDQFIEGKGVPASSLNPLFDRIIAQNREMYDRSERGLRAPPGEVLSALPPAAERAGMVLAFDQNGNPTDSDLVGERGWTPRFAIASDGARRVFQLVGYVGGEGSAPTDHVGEYVGAAGYTAVIGNAVDVRGAPGTSGAGTGDLLAENNLSDLDDIPTARTNLGLGNAATKNTGTGSGDVATGDHTHDSRYYTEAEVDAFIAGLNAAIAAVRAPRIGTVASSSTPTPNADSHDQYNVTALAADATFGAPTGSPVNGQKLVVRIKDNGTAHALFWNAIYRAGTDIALPTNTVISKTLYCGFIFNAADTKWDLQGVNNGF